MAISEIPYSSGSPQADCPRPLKRFGMFGDGLPDSIDKNPLVAARTLRDADKAMVAAAESIFCCRWNLPYVLYVTYPSDYAPFEIESWQGLVLPDSVTRTSPHERVGFGLVFGKKGQKTVQFASDRKSAVVLVSVFGSYYRNDYAITVRQFDKEWIAVSRRPNGGFIE